MKAATRTAQFEATKATISIHAAREGGDATLPAARTAAFTFQSTPPVKAATLRRFVRVLLPPRFQSTPPVKAATGNDEIQYILDDISIHAAREGGDLSAYNCYSNVSDFNPRRP